MKQGLGKYIGAGVAIGSGVGAALFAATRQPFWIATGSVVGMAIGLVLSEERKAKR